MSNKKRAINKANLLLEKRYLIEAETGSSNSSIDADGNKWYIGQVPSSNPAKYRIYVQLKGESGGIDGLQIETKKPELWKKIGYYKSYFTDFTSERNAKIYLDYLIKVIELHNKTGGTSGTAGLNLKPGPGEITRDQLINSMAQNFANQGIGKMPPTTTTTA
jgi:hypothetical protein